MPITAVIRFVSARSRLTRRIIHTGHTPLLGNIGRLCRSSSTAIRSEADSDLISGELGDLYAPLFDQLDQLGEEEKLVVLNLRLKQIFVKSKAPKATSWTSLQDLLLKASVVRRPSSFISAIADIIMAEEVHLEYSAEDLVNSVTVFRYYRSLSSHPLLLFCLSKLETALQCLPLADMPALLNTIGTLGLLKNGVLLEGIIEKVRNGLSDASPKLIAVCVEQLCYSHSLSTDFGDAIVEHILQNIGNFDLHCLATVATSLSYIHLPACSKLLDPLDNLLAKEDTLKKFSEKEWCAIARTFSHFGHRASQSQNLFVEKLYSDAQRLTVNSFVALATFLCLQCNIKDTTFVNVVQPAVRKFWPLFQSEHLASLTPIIVQVSKTAEGAEFAKAFISRIAVRLRDLHGKDFLKIFNSFCQTELFSSAVNRYFMNMILPMLSKLSPKESVQLLGIIHSLNRKTGNVDEKLMNAVVSHISESIGCLSPYLVGSVTMTMNLSRQRNPVLLSEIKRYGLKLLLEGSVDSHVDVLSTIALTLSRMNFAAANMFVELHRRLEAGMIICTTDQLVSLSWACVIQGMIPYAVLRSSLFTLDSAPSGDEPLRHLQMLRDLHVLACEELGMRGFTDEEIVQKLYRAIGVKQMHFAIPMEASDMLRDILGKDSIWCSSLTAQSFLLPAVVLLDKKTGLAVPWESVGADPHQPLPCPKMLAEKHNANALALLTPSLLRPEMAPSGSTVLMMRLLRSCGWKVAMVPQEQWQQFDSFAEKAKFLKQLLLKVFTDK